VHTPSEATRSCAFCQDAGPPTPGEGAALLAAARELDGEPKRLVAALRGAAAQLLPAQPEDTPDEALVAALLGDGVPLGRALRAAEAVARAERPATEAAYMWLTALHQREAAAAAAAAEAAAAAAAAAAAKVDAAVAAAAAQAVVAAAAEDWLSEEEEKDSAD
jgi:hypothetical protein